NHGGGATREDLKVIDRFIAAESRVEVIHSTLERLLDSLQPYGPMAPMVHGDLQRVFTGCYTSLSRLKRRARASLAELLQAEALCAAAWWQRGQEYPEDPLDAVWRDHLFNDFHDILPGTCVEPAERDALDLYGRVSQTARELKLRAAVGLNSGDRFAAELPVLVAHASPALTRVPVEVEFMVDYRPLWSGLWHTRLYSDSGKEIVAQEEQPAARLPFNGWRRKLVAMVDLPEVGVANFHVKRFAGLKENQQHSPCIRHSFHSQAGLIDQLQSASGQNCLAGFLLEPIVASDRGDSWGTAQWENNNVVGRFESVGAPRVDSWGPVRTVTESSFQYASSQILIQTIAYCDWPVLEFRFLVRWNETQNRLKLAIPTVFRESRPECEIPGGTIVRPDDGGQHVHGRCFMLSGALQQGDAAIGVVNSGQHGIDCRDGRVELSVLRSAAYCHERGQLLDDLPATRFMDMGEHEFRLLVTVGEPDVVRRRLPGLADWLDAPPAIYAHLRPTSGKGPKENCDAEAAWGTSHSVPGLIRIEPATVRLTACKKAHGADALIIRLHESIGLATKVHLRIHGVPDRIELSFQRFEIKTLRIERDGSYRTVSMIEEC
ncbi:MAG TPA: glycoside hydrolase family 38 C-terminal domain-containing protein, partial [Pirellulaceae bacterium]|nr:glycoside hydrolase family 38 C-terminal domain-containing protein [Pirellulaceae bacterium]